MSRSSTSPRPSHTISVGAEVVADDVFDVRAVQRPVAVRSEQALLCRHEPPVGVDEDRATLENDRCLEGDVAVALSQDATGSLVASPTIELLAPGVEPEVDAGPAPSCVESEDRSAVAHPGVIERQLDNLNGAGEHGLGLGGVTAAGHDHRDGLEGRHGVGHSGVLALGGTELSAPQLGPAWPCHERALVRSGLGRHSEAGVGGRPGRSEGPHKIRR